MSIHWFPGHMHKAQKEIQQTLPQVDLIIEILDARLPFSSENPLIAKLRGNKPCIKILGKCDLADPKLTQQWQSQLEEERHVKALALSIQQPGNIRQLPEHCRKLLTDKSTREHILHIMITGIPNVGKSTLINILADKAIAKTGNEAAVTRGQQRIRLSDDMVLVDTPGILSPQQEYPDSNYRLAATGAIKDTAMEYDDVAFFIAPYLLQTYPEQIKARYKLDTIPDTEQAFFETIGKQHGCLSRGGLVDFNKICKLFITDLRNGQLGRYTLETPAMVAAEKAVHEVVQATKAAKKAARLEKFKKKKNK